MVRMSTHAHVEAFFSSDLDKILVGANAGGLESLGGQLLVLVGDHVDAERELVDTGTLATSAKISICFLGVLSRAKLGWGSSRSQA